MLLRLVVCTTVYTVAKPLSASSRNWMMMLTVTYKFWVIQHETYKLLTIVEATWTALGRHQPVSSRQSTSTSHFGNVAISERKTGRNWHWPRPCAPGIRRLDARRPNFLLSNEIAGFLTVSRRDSLLLRDNRKNRRKSSRQRKAPKYTLHCTSSNN